MIESIPRIVTGIFAFTGAGLRTTTPLDGAPAYTVPADKRAQLIYLRAGNSADALVLRRLMRDGAPMRLFPIGAKAGLHVPLAVVEDLQPDTEIELCICRPAGRRGHVVLDIGLMEI